MNPTSHFSLLTLLALALSTLFNISQARAQSGIELENVSASVDFGKQITFFATIKSSTSIQMVSIMISEEPQGLTLLEPVTVQADGSTEFHFDTQQNLLRPFTNVKWNYQFTFPDGNTAQSESFFIRYEDDRFEWQTLESDALRVNWYERDASFGQAALDAAQAGLESIDRVMPADLSQPVEFFIYANTEDLRATLTRSGENWAAGHADPALGVVMIAIEPGAEQGIAMEQRIPHELMHVMLYRRVGAGYHNIPAWLREGLATLIEVYPNPDYERVLADAVAADRLIPLQELCGSFPADAKSAFLAYAEARSFTGYLQETYGLAGLLNLAASYAGGLDCERGTERVFGMPLSNLEDTWLSSALGQNALLPAIQNISTYLVLLCLVLIIPLIGMGISLRKKGNPNGPETYVRK
ncbi:MAG TPA: peptidase MA family metallohydrolase [Anaerolineales bacterium]|nr:peptidase MA family metallohydrolase [Anaerolineales bacterium]